MSWLLYSRVWLATITFCGPPAARARWAFCGSWVAALVCAERVFVPVPTFRMATMPFLCVPAEAVCATLALSASK